MLQKTGSPWKPSPVEFQVLTEDKCNEMMNVDLKLSAV